MESIQSAHEINEQKLEALKVQVDEATSPSSSAGAANGVSIQQQQQQGAALKSPSPSNGKTSRSPVDIASQLFSRNKSKSKSKSKKGSTTPRGGSNGNGSKTPQQVNLDNLSEQVKATQQDEMKLVSAAIGISPDGQAVAGADGEPAEGHDEVLDLADQLLAQLDAKKSEAHTASSLSSARPVDIPASGGATTAGSSQRIPIQAPQPVNLASGMNNQTLSSSSYNGSSNNTLEGGSALVHTASASSGISSSSTSTSTSNTTTAAIPTPTASASSRTRHSSSSSSSKPSFGAKLKQALSPSSRDPTPDLSTSPPPLSGNSEAAAQPTTTTIHKNRHAIRKEKKKAADEALRAEAAAEIEAERSKNGSANKYDAADEEKKGIEQLCRNWGLEIIEMDPDGHCMFSAIADQIKSKKIGGKEFYKKADYTTVRKIAAEYMKGHIDDFLPYLPAEDVEGQGEGLLTPEGYARYCDSVENTAEWGSQTELLAISRALELPIWVLQSHSPIVKIGTDEPYGKKKSPLIVSYHRVQYGLGQHYNSCRAMPRESGMIYLG